MAGSLAAGASGHGGSSRVGTVDSLRCFAMTAVVAQHTGLMPFGWTGVWLFYVISGFVVTLSVIGRQSSMPRSQQLSGFFGRRVRRILPVYYLYVVAGIGLMFFLGDQVDALAVGSLLGFFNNVTMIIGRGELAGWPVGHLWTISVEMQFYLVYGVLLVFAPRRIVIALLLASLLFAPAMRAIASVGLDTLDWTSEAKAYAIYAGPFLHVDAFAMGSLLAFASRRQLLARIAIPLAGAGFLVLACYAATYVYVNYAVVGARNVDVLRNVVSGIMWGQHREVFAYSAIIAAASGLVALAATRHTAVDWLLRHPVLQRIGEISYGAYVYHALAIMLCLKLLFWQMDIPQDGLPLSYRLLLFGSSYLLTIAMAELSFRYFESRFLTPRAKTGALSARPSSAPN